MASIFTTFLNWVIGFAFFVPFQMLNVVSLILPSCESLGIPNITNTVVNVVIPPLRFFWPMIKYVPWEHVWNMVSAVLLFELFMFVWSKLPWLMSLSFKVWIVIIALYVVSTAVSIFTSFDYQDEPVFTDVFGTSGTVNGAVGGGAGGGGGGSW